LTSDADPPAVAVVLDMEGTNIIDLEGSDALHEVVVELKDTDIQLCLARTKAEIVETLEQDGVLDTLGREYLFDHVHEAVEAIRASTADGEQTMTGSDGSEEQWDRR
jgi:MFS superfamily sulfate permease-like transporter